jgi:hypothetical protein
VTLRAVGRVPLGVAIAGLVAGLGVLLSEAVSASSDTGANLGLLSLGLAAVVVVVAFPVRNRIRLAREAMFVGLATLGGWLLLFAYALAVDTPRSGGQ